MAVAKIEVTIQQLVDALGIDVRLVREIVQTPDDRIAGKLTLVVDADWAVGLTHPLRLEDTPMRVLATKEP